METVYARSIARKNISFSIESSTTKGIQTKLNSIQYMIISPSKSSSIGLLVEHIIILSSIIRVTINDRWIG